MKIALIHPKMYIRSYYFFPLGLGFIASALQSRSMNFAFYDIHKNWTKTSKFLKIVEKDGPFDIFAITALQSTFLNASDICNKLKDKFPNAIIVLGGKITVNSTSFLFENFNIDYAIRGEGEVAFLELLEALEGKREKASVKGLLYRDDNGLIHSNGESDFIENINDFMIPFEKFDMSKYVVKNTVQSPNLPSLNMVSSRGCPFACTFCNFSKSRYKRMRYYDLELLGKQWDYLIENFGLKHITFNDDIFTVNKKRTKEICSVLKEKRLSFSCSTRLDALNEEIINVLEKSGCKYLCIGIESPSPTVAKIIDKRLDLDRYQKNIDLLKNTSITVNFGFMIGYYGETEETIEETREFVIKNGLIYSSFFATAFPDTKLYDLVRNKIPDEEIYLKQLSQVDLSSDYLINMTDMPLKKVYSLHDYLVADSVINAIRIDLPFKRIVRKLFVFYLVFMRKYGIKNSMFKRIFEFINIVIVKPLVGKNN
ncbi:B12-binding domain-containing radical SAM protein [Desulfobacula phenolica]|uniref:Radical SAM superfamily enzyme YgiQ, UPF0313 family n=1 Tax=Desulfobacula phenolica TaxID=90732 RepID=A0A1H2DRQ9_9BACT|nr:radical SAM protein [Desulfobacula phenolica]SDT85583.1 Radical SAM superfamily enzyme YgiQ, UPF0313 family [Desulfobacula phenolica]